MSRRIRIVKFSVPKSTSTAVIIPFTMNITGVNGAMNALNKKNLQNSLEKIIKI